MAQEAKPHPDDTSVPQLHLTCVWSPPKTPPSLYKPSPPQISKPLTKKNLTSLQATNTSRASKEDRTQFSQVHVASLDGHGEGSSGERWRCRAAEAVRVVGELVHAPRAAGDAAQGAGVRVRGGGPRQQERRSAAPQPRLQEGPRARPPRRPLPRRVRHHPPLPRRSVPGHSPAPPRRPLRPRRRPLLVPLRRRQARAGGGGGVRVDGRGAGGGGAAGAREPGAAGGGAAGGGVQGAPLLRRRRGRLPRRRPGLRLLLAGRLRGGDRRAAGGRRRVPALPRLAARLRGAGPGEGDHPLHRPPPRLRARPPPDAARHGRRRQRSDRRRGRRPHRSSALRGAASPHHC